MSINVKGRNRVYSLGNLGCFIAFGALTVGIWFALLFVGSLIITQLLPSFQHGVTLALVLALFAIAISWILVGRKIVWPQIVYISLLGPFNFWQPAHFNLRQLRIVWVAACYCCSCSFFHSGKGTLLDIGTNVPLIANWSGQIAAGSVRRELVDFSDWLPTLAEIGGAKVEHKIDGVSFASTLFGSRPHVSRNFAFSESRSDKAWVRTKRYKLYNTGEFYDVWNDAQSIHR